MCLISVWSESSIASFPAVSSLGCHVSTVPFPIDKPASAPPSSAYVETSSPFRIPSPGGPMLSEVEHIKAVSKFKMSFTVLVFVEL